MLRNQNSMDHRMLIALGSKFHMMHFQIEASPISFAQFYIFPS